MIDDKETNWTAVLARCIAYACLEKSLDPDATMLEKAEFLVRFGLPAKDRAALLGTTIDSLGAQARQAKKSKTAKKKGTVKHAK